MIALGLLLALGSAAALNWGFFVQHGAAAALPRLELRHPAHSLRLLLSNRRWVLGFVTGLGGWALYVAALGVAPLSLVQATSAGGIGLLALLVHRTSGLGLSRTQRRGVWLSVAGLFLLGISLAGSSDAGGQASWEAVAVWLGASAAAATVAVGGSRRLLAAGAGLGAAAGLLYAAGDVATKAAVGGGARLAFVAAVLAAHGLAFVALQLGFQRGGALATAGVATLLTNALPIVAGMTLFHEALPGGALGAARVLAFAAVVAGAAAFAAPDGERGTGSYPPSANDPARDRRAPSLRDSTAGPAAGLDARAHGA